jgi:phosphoribosylformimino-5-aminoimidazole carboxamide ribotide isomerase
VSYKAIDDRNIICYLSVIVKIIKSVSRHIYCTSFISAVSGEYFIAWLPGRGITTFIYSARHSLLMPFNVIPAIDLKDGKAVSLVQGVPGTGITPIDDPIEVAANWVGQGAKTLHIIDLDGALSGRRKNAYIMEEIISKFKVDVQVGGGIRDYDTAKYLLDMGIDRVILGTAAIRDPPLVRKLSDDFGSDAIIVSLDSKKGEVLVEGWTAGSGKGTVEMGQFFEKQGAGSILFTDVDVEGLLKGVNVSPISKLTQAVGIPVIASGGVTTIDDIINIKKAGAAGVVVGAALFRGNFTLREAIDEAARTD